MNKQIIKVPKGIQFISNWKEYSIPRNQHCIVDKGVTGCGYTEYCLTNSDNIILVSPRKTLMENKIAQHIGDKNIYYAKNEIIDIDTRNKYINQIYRHIEYCLYENLPCKIMVSYDSLHYVVSVLKELNLNSSFQYIVDEFQSIFLDSFFKAEIELDFVEVLQNCESVVYLSATPMLDKYLIKLNQFKNLNFYMLDWSETGFVETVNVERKKVDSLTAACGKIIQQYLAGDYPITLNSNNEVVESKEAVFYLNSITDITRIIKKYGLTDSNTRIICAGTPENAKKLQKINFTVGSVPLKDEKNPMFMFCTSTSYIGVDFYSDNASSYVFADPNLKHLALDISLDLPQIVGRQRDKSNPFKNNIVIFYKIFKNKKLRYTKEDFDELQRERRNSSDLILEAFYTLTEEQKKLYTHKLKSDVIVSQYSRDFVSISKETGLPVYNPLIDIANERAWEVSQKEYQDNISVTRSIERLGFKTAVYSDPELNLITSFLEEFFSTGVFKKRLKAYCIFRDQYKENSSLIEELNHRIKDQKYSRFYEYFGTAGCRAHRYEELELLKMLKNSSKSNDLSAEVYNRFKEGECYVSRDLKNLLSSLYTELHISRTAKASDLNEYFDLVPVKISLPNKTRVNGFKLNKKE